MVDGLLHNYLPHAAISPIRTAVASWRDIYFARFQPVGGINDGAHSNSSHPNASSPDDSRISLLTRANRPSFATRLGAALRDGDIHDP